MRTSARRPAWLIVFGALWMLGSPVLQAQSAPTSATVKEWDIFAATGGDGAASQNVAALLMDVSGIAGPAGNVWVTLQNPLPRLGRLDPSASVNNYLEWRPVTSSEAGGAPLGIALNKGNADIWMAMQGDPSFLMKLGNTNTFRRYRSTYPLVPHGIAVASDNAAIAALPVRNAGGIGNAIVKVPRNPTSGAVTITLWNVGGEPRHVAIDNSGNIWFTQRLTNKLARLAPSSGVVTEWLLPSGTNPSGVQGASNTICVASEGGMGDLTGVEHCLNTSNNQITTYARAPGDGFDLPQQTAVNSDTETFVTEQNGNSLSFVAFAARAAAAVATVTPTTRTVGPKSTKLFVSDFTSAPVTLTVTSTQTTLTGLDDGGGYVRFSLPPVSLTYPFALTGYPQPVSVTPVFNDQGRGTGAIFFGQYFDGPILGRSPAARVARLELEAPAIATSIITNPQTLRFDAIAGSAAPGAQSVAISEAASQAIAWTATKTQSWLTLSPGSGTTPSSMSVSVNHSALAAGTYTDTITVDDGPGGGDAREIAVTLNVTGQATIAAAPSSMTFAATVGGALTPAQTLAITNTGSGTLDWTATTSQPWLLLRQTSGTAPSSVEVIVNPAAMASGTQSATITVTSAGATNSPVTVNVTAIISESGPAISLSPASMSFSATVGGGNPVAQTLTVTNSGGGTLAWTASPTATWLSVSPASGTTISAASSTASVSIDIAGLARGTYNGTITVTDASATNSPQELAVTLAVTAPVIGVSPASVTLTAVRTGASPANETITISNTGDATLNYTTSVTSGGSWLSIASGGSAAVAPSGNASLVLAFNTAALAKGVHTGTVQIADPNAGNSPVTITVSLTITAPVIGVSPASLTYSVLRGRSPASQTITVSNTGDAPLDFTATASTTGGGSWLSVSPASGTVAAGGSTTLTATVTSSALASGSYTGSISVADPKADNSPQTASVTLTVDPAATIALSPSTLSVTAAKGGTNPANQTVTVGNTGDATLNYTAAITSSSPWLTIASGGSGAVAASESANLVLAIDITGLAKGLYSATVEVADANATNTPQTVTVTLTITAPTIDLTPPSLTFTTLRGRDPGTQTITVTNSGDAPLNFSAAASTTSGGAWLAVSPASGTVAAGANTTLTVTVTSSGLSTASYTGSITVTDAGATNSPQIAAVALTVNAAPTIALNTGTLSFSTAQGSNPATQTFTVTNTGDASLNFTPAVATSSGGAWLSVSPSGAQSIPASGGSAVFTVTVTSASLAAGAFAGTITISDATATNDPQVVSVALTVTPSPVIDVSPATLTFAATKGGANPADQFVTLSNTGSATLNYSATVTSGASWLAVSPSSGAVAAGGSTPLTVSVTTSALAVGANAGTIEISDPSAGNSPRTITVTATLTAAAISLDPASLTFTVLRSRDPNTQTIALSNTGTAPLSFSTAASTVSGGAWLAVSPASGSVAAGGSTTLTVTVTSASLTTGSYSGSITVSDPNASNSPQATAVSLTVNPAPTIALDPASLTFSTLRGRSPAAQTITVNNTGDGPLNFSATTAGGGWLSVTPASGTVAAGGSTALTVTIASDALVSGSYSGSVTVADADATNSPQVTTVSLTVDPAATIVLDPASLSFTTLRGRNPATQTILLSNTGDAPLDFAAAPAGGGWLAVSPLSGTVAAGGSTTLTVTITSSALATGSYSGSVTVTDVDATNTPQVTTVGLTVTAAPTIALDPASLSFTTLRGRSPASQTVTVNNTGDGPLNFTAGTTGGGWLSVAPASGTVAGGASTILTVSIASNALATGSYSGSVTVTDADATNSPQSAAVSLTVNPAPTIGVSPAAISLTAARGGANPANQTVTISNSGDASLDHTASVTSGDWLSIVSGGSGSVAASGSASLVLGIDITGLAKGVHVGTVEVADANATNSPQVVTVTLTIQAPTISLNQASLTFTTLRGRNPVTQSIVVTNTGDAPLNFSAGATGGAWLDVSPASGTVAAGGDTTLTVTVSSSALTSGSYSGSIDVIDATATNSPQSVAVSLTVSPAPTIGLSNTTLNFTAKVNAASPANQTVTLTNTGDATLSYSATASSSGWLSVSPVSGSLAAAGGTPLTISVNNAGLSAGTYVGTIEVADPNATNTPQTITVTHVVTAAATISLSPTTLTFSSARLTVCNGVTAGSNPASQTVTLSNTGQATLNYSAAASMVGGGSWLSVTPASGAVAAGGNTTLTVSIDLTGLAIGTYTGTITVSDPDASNSPQTVSITLNVTAAAPRLCVTPVLLELGNVVKNTQVTGNFFVTNAGDGTLTWTSTAPTTYADHQTIGRVPTSGTAPTTITFTVKPKNTAALTARTSTFDITGSDGTTITVTITWTVIA